MSEWFKIGWLPLGTFFNVFCILVGGTVGLILSRQLPDETQRRVRRYLAGLTVLAGGYMIANGLYGGWKGAEGGVWEFLLLGLITLLAISFGNLFGTWLKLQEWLDKLGQEAKKRLTKSDEEDGNISNSSKKLKSRSRKLKLENEALKKRLKILEAGAFEWFKVI